MSLEHSEKTMKEKFTHLLKVMSSKRFLEMQGIGLEVPFFIFPFKPGESVDMERQKRQLIKQLSQIGKNILEINLYDLSTELLKARGIWEQVLAAEKTITKEQLKELLQGVLDPETYLVPAIADKIGMLECDIIFISGIGEVFPYIRSHSVLNNLQSVVKEKPLVLFFPGAYTHSLESGTSLELFEKDLKNDKYYRAFNILHYEV